MLSTTSRPQSQTKVSTGNAKVDQCSSPVTTATVTSNNKLPFSICKKKKETEKEFYLPNASSIPIPIPIPA